MDELETCRSSATVARNRDHGSIELEQGGGRGAGGEPCPGSRAIGSRPSSDACASRRRRRCERSGAVLAIEASMAGGLVGSPHEQAQ